MKRLDQKALPADFVQKVMSVERFLGNYHFYIDLRNRSERTTSAQELFVLCKKHARADDWACEKKEEIRPDNCTIFGQAERHLNCWFLYKKSLSILLEQK